MPTIKKYVPILRWRLAELSAVEKLYPKDRENITPLIELVMPAPTTDKEDYKKVIKDPKTKFLSNLGGISQQILKCWGRDLIFIDVHLLDGDVRSSALEQILSASSQLDIFSVPVIYIIPVTSTDADMETRKVAVKFSKINNRGLCIRIDESHLADNSLSEHIENFIATNELKIEDTDLLIDLRIIDSNISPEFVVERLSKLPRIEMWRSLILSGGAFPKDLSHLEKHGHHQIERLDWTLWNNIIKSKTLKRRPIFSDYAIQHPIYYGYMPGVINTSASIRYANDTKWEVLRGEGLRNEKGAGHNQYPAQAKLLTEQSFFKGTNFSFGDKYISERADNKNTKTGNPTTWLTAGINHHLTLVAKQVSNLP